LTARSFAQDKRPGLVIGVGTDAGLFPAGSANHLFMS